MSKSPIAFLLLLLLAAPAFADGPTIVSQEIAVRLEPETHRLFGQAELRVKGLGAFTFLLHPDMAVTDLRAEDPALEVAWDVKETKRWLETVVTLPEGATDPEGGAVEQVITVTYEGPIYDAVDESGALAFIVGDDTRGVIAEEGIYLVASSGWYPRTDDVCAYARISVDVPEYFRVVTQGGLVSRDVKGGRELTVWGSDVPVDGLALQAGKYEVTTRQVGDVSISTYLFDNHKQHAPFILDQVANYLELYGELLGPFPWPKFDVVENFFTTGYGMPTYTLLGANVVDVMVRMAPRYGGNLPPGFVDHELVHCYWGNYVYPDYATGNWCEGLTSYCANYLMKERQGIEPATAHRKKASVNFSIRVDEENDYPVRAFRGKTEDFDNDIGYSKSMMIFHMVRKLIGDDAFWGSLRKVVRDFGGQKASWADFERTFSEASGKDLSGFFKQWLDRTGAPSVQPGTFTVTRTADGLYEVKGTIVSKDDDPWHLAVPVTVDHASGESCRVVELTGASAEYSIVVPSPPLRVHVDKRFHLFRAVFPLELQACLNLTMECKDKAIVTPEGNPAWTGFARMVKGRKGGEIVSGADGLPKTHCILFGLPDENPAVAEVLEAAKVVVAGNSVTIKGKKYEAEDLWLILSVPHPKVVGGFVTVLLGVSDAALRNASRAFHFGWDGYVVYGNGRPLGRGHLYETKSSDIRTFDLPANDALGSDTMRTLAAPGMHGRLAGTEGDAAARKDLKTRLANAGLKEIEEVPFSFTVLDHTDKDAWTVARGKLEDGTTDWSASFPGAVVPAVFSAECPDDVVIKKIAKYGGAVDGETLVVLPPEANAEALMLLVSQAATSGAAAVAIPMSVLESKDKAVGSLAGYPSRLTGRPDSWLAAAGMQVRAPKPTFRIGDTPVVFIDEKLLPPGGEGEANARLRVRFEKKTVETANITAVVPNHEGRTDGPGPVLSAHFDGLGEGYAGADDNASGVAAVIEAARLLAGRRDLLGRPVRVFLFGAEEWGLMGSRAMVAAGTEGIEALVNLDTVGAKDASEIYLIGRSAHPELAALAAACFEAEGFPVGRDIDKFAFAHGSDHWPYHEAGIPALDLFSGQYRRMNSKDDVLDLVDDEKVGRIASATARMMLHLAAGDSAEEKPAAPPVTVFENEATHLTNLKMLTSGGENAEAYFPAECDRFSFQSKRGEMKADQIFVMDLDGKDQRMVSNGKGATTCAYLFPGSKRVIYATTAFNGDEPPAPPDRSKGYVWKLHPEFDLVAHDIDGKNEVRLTKEWGYDAEATLSPDGQWIVFTSCRDGGDPEVYKMKADGSELTRLTNAEGYDGGPFFSWDGKLIIWRANRPKTDDDKVMYRALIEEGLVSPMNLEIFVMNADGTNPRQVTGNGAANFAPFMHPDSRRIIFCSNLATLGKRGMPNFDLWMINIDGTGLERITTCPEFDGFPMFTKDGRKLVFCSNRDNGGTRETNVFLADWKN